MALSLPPTPDISTESLDRERSASPDVQPARVVKTARQTAETPAVHPRPLIGPSVRIRLLKTFLPVVAVAVVIYSILQNIVFSHTHPVIALSFTAVLSMGIAGLLVFRSSALLSYEIEQAVQESEERWGRKEAEALRQKSAFAHMLQIVSSAANASSGIEQAMHIALDQVCQQTGWPLARSWVVSSDTGLLHCVNAHRPQDRYRDFKAGESLARRVLVSGIPAWGQDIAQPELCGDYAFPVKIGHEVVAVLEFFSEDMVDPSPALLEVMGHVGTQLGRVVERSRAEAALRESEMRFRSVAQSASDAIVSCNAFGRVIAWNKGARLMFGRSEEDILGQPLSQIVPDGLRMLSRDDMTQMMNVPPSLLGRTIETVGLTQSGESFPIELSVADWKIGEDVFFTVIIRNITTRKEAEAQINASLKEKEVLLKEIHHRVKNNLQIVCSLLRLQSQHLVDPDMLDMFRESQNRVKSMALIHEYLYQSQDLAHIQFPKYIRNLVLHLFRSYGATPEKVRLEVLIDECPLDLDTAIPCGLIITELVSNALKYAFPLEREGFLRVEFRAFDGATRFELGVHDNGAGMPKNLNENSSASLGLRLVQTLTQQLHGTLQIQNNPGTHVVISFNRHHPSRRNV